MQITAHVNRLKCADCQRISHSHSITNQGSSHLASEFNLVVDTFPTLQRRKFMEISPRGRLIDCNLYAEHSWNSMCTMPQSLSK